MPKALHPRPHFHSPQPTLGITHINRNIEHLDLGVIGGKSWPPLKRPQQQSLPTVLARYSSRLVRTCDSALSASGSLRDGTHVSTHELFAVRKKLNSACATWTGKSVR